MKLIAGPCVIESAELLDKVAARLVEINRSLGTEIIFKASFDKANRTSIHSFRGPGLERGLQLLADVKQRWGLSLLTDIHEAWQAEAVGQVVDVVQIPAFLCRQTDLLVAAARTGRIVNIKKGQFLSGADMRYPVEKAREAGAREIWLTERGNSFGYNNLVVDFRNIADMTRLVDTVVMDCTHSVQRPGAGNGTTSGNREFVPSMALAAKAIGANPTAARQSGINLVQYKVYAYIIMGVCVVLAALFQMGYTASASDSTGTGFEMNVMVALILGGMPLSGGMKSKVSCAIVGSFTYALLSVCLPMLGVAANQVFVIKAVLFLIVVVLTCCKKTGVLPR